MQLPTFGKWLGAAIVVTIGIAMLEQWDERIAWTAAVLILLAAFFRYPVPMAEFRKLLGV